MKISVVRFRGNEVYREEIPLNNFLSVEFDTEEGATFAVSFIGRLVDVRSNDHGISVQPWASNNIHIGSTEKH